MPRAHERCFLRDIGTDRHRPERQLVPRQQVAGEGKEQRDQQQRQTDQPVGGALCSVRAGEEDAQHVQKHHQHHQVRRPAVLVAQQPAEPDDVVDVLDAPVGLLGGRHVEEHQQHAGDRQDQEEEGGDGAEPQAVAPREALLDDLRRKPVQPEVLDDRGAGFALAGGAPGPRHPAPQPLQPRAQPAPGRWRADQRRLQAVRCAPLTRGSHDSRHREAIGGGDGLGGIDDQKAVARHAQRIPEAAAAARARQSASRPPGTCCRDTGSRTPSARPSIRPCTPGACTRRR